MATSSKSPGLISKERVYTVLPWNRSRSRYYCNAFLWECQDAMHEALGEVDGAEAAFMRADNATTRVTDRGWQKESRPLLGEIHLVAEGMEPGHVIHECVHAGVHMYRSVGPDSGALYGEGFDGMAEEFLAYAVEGFAASVLAWLSRVKESA